MTIPLQSAVQQTFHHDLHSLGLILSAVLKQGEFY